MLSTFLMMEEQSPLKYYSFWLTGSNQCLTRHFYTSVHYNKNTNLHMPCVKCVHLECSFLFDFCSICCLDFCWNLLWSLQINNSMWPIIICRPMTQPIISEIVGGISSGYIYQQGFDMGNEFQSIFSISVSNNQCIFTVMGSNLVILVNVLAVLTLLVKSSEFVVLTVMCILHDL